MTWLLTVQFPNFMFLGAARFKKTVEAPDEMGALEALVEELRGI